MSAGDNQHAVLKQLVQDRMLEWKCRVENPPRKRGTPMLVTAPTTPVPKPNSSTSDSERLLEKLPKILAFENPSGGAGAPRRTPSGRIQTDLRGHADIRFHQPNSSVFEQSLRYQLDKDQIRRYKQALDQQLEDKRGFLSRMKHTNNSEKTSDLATIMSSRSNNVIRRWESLPKLTSTDVTRNYVNSPRTPDADEFRRGLASQLESKQLLKEQHLKQEKYLNNLHFNAFDNFWGKPGAGAAKSTKRKENLFKLLHGTR